MDKSAAMTIESPPPQRRARTLSRHNLGDDPLPYALIGAGKVSRVPFRGRDTMSSMAKETVARGDMV